MNIYHTTFYTVLKLKASGFRCLTVNRNDSVTIHSSQSGWQKAELSLLQGVWRKKSLQNHILYEKI